MTECSHWAWLPLELFFLKRHFTQSYKRTLQNSQRRCEALNRKLTTCLVLNSWIFFTWEMVHLTCVSLLYDSEWELINQEQEPSDPLHNFKKPWVISCNLLSTFSTRKEWKTFSSLSFIAMPVTVRWQLSAAFPDNWYVFWSSESIACIFFANCKSFLLWNTTSPSIQSQVADWMRRYENLDSMPRGLPSRDRWKL